MLFQKDKKLKNAVNSLEHTYDIEQINNFLIENINYEFNDKVFLNKDIFNDLDIFNNDNSEINIFDKLNFTKTLFGKYYLKNLLQNPTFNYQILNKRQNFIKTLILNKNIIEISNTIDEFKDIESNLIWFWKYEDFDGKNIDNLLFYNYYLLKAVNDKLNDNNIIMNISSFYSIYLNSVSFIFNPLLTILIPIIISKIYFRNTLNIPISSMFKFVFNSLISSPIYLNVNNYIISLILKSIYYVLYLNSIYTTIYLCICKYSMVCSIKDKVNSVNKIVSSYIKFENLLTLDQQKYLKNNDNIEILFLDNHNIGFFNIGNILTQMRNIIKNRDKLINYIKYFGKLDGYLSIIKNLINNQFNNNKISLANFHNNNKMISYSYEITHPLLINSQKNNIKLNGDKFKIGIITGPNASGKSTFIKMITINALFSQSWGISFTKNNYVSIYNYINTFMRINDEVGKQSLFQMEIKRCREILDVIKNKNKNDKCLFVIDEIFSSTNSNSGLLGAKELLQKLENYDNIFVYLTTHYYELNNLGKFIKNFQFDCDLDKNNEIIYNYKIKKGLNTKNIGYKLIKEKLFES